MPGSGLHQQVKVLWRNHRLAVNIWGTGRVHIQGKGASHFAQLLLNAKGVSSHSEPQPQRSPVLSESPPISGSYFPGQAGSLISCIIESVSGVFPVFPRLRVSAMFVLHYFVRFLGCFLLGSVGSFLSSLLGRMMELLLESLFLRRWSRHRHKRIRGIGSQAASRRGANSRRLALASKAHSFSVLARVSRWTKAFRLTFRLSHTSRQRSAVWQATGPLLVTAVTFSLVLSGPFVFSILSAHTASFWAALGPSLRLSYPCGRRHSRY